MQWVKTWSAARGLQGAWLGLLLLQLLRCARACARRSCLVRVVHVLKRLARAPVVVVSQFS